MHSSGWLGNRTFMTLMRCDQDPAIQVTIMGERDGAHTGIFFRLDCDAGHVRSLRRMRHAHDFMNLLPALLAPPGAQQSSEGGSSVGNRVSTSASLTTALEPAAVAPHYEEQLAKSGWQHLDGGVAGPVVWSSWMFNNEEGLAWREFFFAVRQPDRRRDYFLLLRAETADQSSPFRGGFRSCGTLSSR